VPAAERNPFEIDALLSGAKLASADGENLEATMKQPVVSAILFSCLLAAAACGKPESTDATSAPSASPLAAATPPAGALVRVDDPSQVCMVNDHYMGKPQIPVVVGEKTYFGCCAMCKQKLETDPSARSANDPVTGHPVDKALAVIGRDATGHVRYFESEGTLARYR
jgi:hypothetical protein